VTPAAVTLERTRVEPARPAPAEPGLADVDAVLAEVLPAGVAEHLVAAMRKRVRPLLDVAGDGVQTPIAYAAAALCRLPIGRDPDRLLVDRLVDAVGERAGLSRAATRTAIFGAALADLAVLDDPPESRLVRLVHLVAGVMRATGVSLWVVEATKSPPLVCVAWSGSGARSRRARDAAARVIGGCLPEGRGAAVVLARPGALYAHAPNVSRTRCGAYLELSAPAVRSLLAQVALIQGSARRETTLVESAERRLLRLGFDLHDGPAQRVAALAADARVARSRVVELEGANHPLAGALEGVVGGLDELAAEIRDLAHSLESRALLLHSLDRVLARELETFSRRTGIATSLDAEGDFGALTPSQQLALVRVTQEALTNVREHARAGRVVVQARKGGAKITVAVQDDGRGFDVAHASARAARRERLGLAGMQERIGLLGGRLDVESRPGGPTRIVAVVPEWRPDAPGAGATADAQ
jgi:signal transduction histidine kinase